MPIFHDPAIPFLGINFRTTLLRYVFNSAMIQVINIPIKSGNDCENCHFISNLHMENDIHMREYHPVSGRSTQELQSMKHICQEYNIE
jgi:hypothetical protein